MQVETLKVFCDLVETTSFSAAAERNRITQSAVSQKVRNLEQAYGVALVERGAGRPFRLTPEGEAFYEACREMVGTYDAIPGRLLRAQGDLRGEVTVATVPSLGLYDLAVARRRFSRTYPGVRVEATYPGWSKAYTAVETRAADFALLAYPENRKGFELEHCWQDKLVLVCPLKHRLARYGTVGMRELRGERFVLCFPDEAAAAAMQRALHRAKVEITALFEVRTAQSAMRAVEVEGVLTILPENQVPDQPELFRSVVINSPDMRRPVALVRKAGEALSPAAQEFARALRELRG